MNINDMLFPDGFLINFMAQANKFLIIKQLAEKIEINSRTLLENLTKEKLGQQP